MTPQAWSDCPDIGLQRAVTSTLAAVTGLYIATKNRKSIVLVDSCASALPPPAVGSASISQRPGPPSPARPNSKSFGGCPGVSPSNVTVWPRAASPLVSHVAAARTHNHRLVSMISPMARLLGLPPQASRKVLKDLRALLRRHV